MIQDSPISAVVLTLNETRNITACMEGLAHVARDVLVVDSGSLDGTVERARELGARVIYNKFTTHAEQSRALRQGLSGDWILALDADQRVSPDLASSLLRIARSAGRDVEGVYVNRLHVFRGTPMRHGGLFPKWMLKMFRNGMGITDARDLADHRFYVIGRSVKASGLLIEANQNESAIAFWVEKHNSLAGRQATEDLHRARQGASRISAAHLFGTPDARVLWLKVFWDKMPRYFRPILYFMYRYILRMGFLDGKQGFVFHVMQAFWYRLLVDIKFEELLADEKFRQARIPVSDSGRVGRRSS